MRKPHLFSYMEVNNMASKNYNVRQVTNYDIQEKPIIENYTISVPERNPNPPYDIHFVDEIVPYKIAISGMNIIKLGYCCSPNGIIYPIILKINNQYEQIKLGKECMYEFQPEEWKNINEENSTIKTSDIIVTEVRVPADIKFTLEYVTEY